MSEKRTFKKYKNRRLYCSFLKQYINLDHLIDLIFEGMDFEVIEHGSGRDVTLVCMLQALAIEADVGLFAFEKKDLIRLIRGKR